MGTQIILQAAQNCNYIVYLSYTTAHNCTLPTRVQTLLELKHAAIMQLKNIEFNIYNNKLAQGHSGPDGIL